MASLYDWSTTADDNGNSDSAISWAEGQLPGTVNKSARSMMGRIAEILGDIGGALTAGGTANALTVTANSAFTTYANGRIVAFRASADNTGAATLNVNGIGAKSIRRMGASGEEALSAGDIKDDWVYIVRYSTTANSGAGAWLLDWAPKPEDRIDYVPIGAVQDYAGSTAPTGWLMCYGQAISRATYADLFAVIGTTYGTGDGSTTFNVPDLRGRVVAGQDDMGGTSADRLTNQTGGIDGDTLGASGGSETHTLTEAQLPAHTHDAGTLATASNGAHTHTIALHGDSGAGGSNTEGTNGGSFGANDTTSSNGAHTHTITGSTASVGSGSAHNNVQPTFILNKIIFAGV